MKYLCAADPAAFETFLDARLREHNDRERNPAYLYERVPADDGLVAVRIYRGRDYDLIAVMETAVEDGYLALNVQMEDVPACVARAHDNETAETEVPEEAVEAEEAEDPEETEELSAADGDTPSLAPKIAAYLTKFIVLCAFLWASVWGISYLMGNRNPWLALIAPAAYLLFFAVARCIQYRPRDAKGDFAAFLENDLAATPCLADAEEETSDETETDETETDETETGETETDETETEEPGTDGSETGLPGEDGASTDGEEPPSV